MAEAEKTGVQVKAARGILIVCPSDNTIGTLATILSENNETALTAQNPKDAWEVIKAGSVGCVVLDLTTMSPDSWVLFRTARSSELSAQVPFLFLIKKDSKISRLDVWGMELTHDSWLVLPCSAQLFLTAVRSLLDFKINREVKPASTPMTETAILRTKAEGDVNELHDVKASVLSGHLGLLDVTKILSMVEPLKLTGILRLSDGKRSGKVFFVEGSVRHAQLNEIEGPDALFLLFHLKTGAFRFELGQATTVCTIEGNTMTLLLEGLRQMDEAKAMVMAFQTRKTGPNPVLKDSAEK